MDLYCTVFHDGWDYAYSFYCEDVQLIRVVLNNFQFKNNCFISMWYSNLGSERLHIQTIKYIQEELTSPYYNVQLTI